MLADPSLPRQPGDALKYVRLSRDDPARFLSFGVTLRERFEHRDADLFGTGTRQHENYLLHRLELHADAHLTDRARVFIQFENALAPGRKDPTPVDANEADLRLAFIDTTVPASGGEFQIRIGRQEVAFDLERFASARDGVNVRQAFDALWVQYTRNDWSLSLFASRPVQYQNESAFDDFSNKDFIFFGTRAKRLLADGGSVSATISSYRREGNASPPPHLREHRQNLDIHYAGAGRGFDWDVEAMVQRGTLGDKGIRAWGAGSLAGYTFDAYAWRPRIGLQLDAASGDRNPNDGTSETFNPLFPNGYYINLSGFTGYTNFIHLKPSLTLQPEPGVTLLLAAGMLWRESIHDAAYAQPTVPIAGTAGHRGRRTAVYGQLRAEWAVARSLALAFEANYYDVASSIRDVGGRDSNYISTEVRWAW